MASITRVMLVVLVSVAAVYDFYLALQWVASESARGGLGG